MKLYILISLLLISGCGKDAGLSKATGDLVSTTQITDASTGYAGQPQYLFPIYPPVINDNNYVNDITNLDLYYYNIAPLKQRKALIMFGDSRTVLFAGDYQFPITVYSFARGGSTSVGVMDRLPNLRNFMAPEDPSIGGIFIQVGINDIVGTRLGFNITNFQANYTQIANYLTTYFPNVPVTIGDVITYNATTVQSDYDDIDTYNNFLRILCKTYGFTFIEMNPLMAMPDRTLNPLYDADGIHFTHAGFDVMYNQVMAHYLNF